MKLETVRKAKHIASKKHNRPAWCCLRKQESLANAKVSARHPWYAGRNSLNLPPLRIAQQYQRNLYIVEKYLQCATTITLSYSAPPLLPFGISRWS